jgi:hypothetical protein
MSSSSSLLVWGVRSSPVSADAGRFDQCLPVSYRSLTALLLPPAILALSTIQGHDDVALLEQITLTQQDIQAVADGAGF